MPLTDTSPEAERVLAEVYRSMPPGKKWLLVRQAYRRARMLHAAGVRLRNPEATPHQILEDWIHRELGFPHVPVAQEPVMDLSAVDLGAGRDVLRVRNRLGIPYAIGGSVASSIHGDARHTQDSDITTEPFPVQVEAFVASFDQRYYLGKQAVEEANRTRSCFNSIDTSTGLKEVLFIRPDRAFEQTALSRRLTVTLPDAPEEPVFVFTPEDILLFKLRWYRLGNEASDRQWEDVLGVLRAQAGQLDEAYLDQWAEQLGVADLLVRARQESKV